MGKTRAVEITAQDLFSVKAAIEGGADRVELCTALGTAGLTPSIGLIEGAVELASKNGLKGFVDVLVRPREGDFVYDLDEVETAIRDIRLAVAAGVDGVVIGALRTDGSIDCVAMSRMMEAAGDTPVVFHRAFDVLADQFVALEELIEMGVVRILTSGAAPKTGDGISRLQELVKRANGRVEIMAGGGVQITEIRQLFDIGVDAVHLSAKRAITGGPNRPGEKASYFQADVGLVRAAVESTC
ncbi:copper homeostasis protein CutC [Sporosarcina beigongshangi]|uniref:copper homeostasis protein CutC n=1 Tax=Sporosarcina beigongshangi TaxID=2782538 RepID=UPI00193957B6|nr:copper homeostasis protein CutC [Sporosarcina beigongshangi]